MLRLGLGPQIGTNTPADSGGAQVIWKVAIYGAGTPTSNGEYVWDGIETDDLQPVYRKGISYISWSPDEGVGAWTLYDVDVDETTYISLGLNNLTSWQVANGLPDAPSSALSYAQDSFISSITLTEAGEASSDGTYTRTSGGSTSFTASNGNAFEYDDGPWLLADIVFGGQPYRATYDPPITNWEIFAGSPDSPAPTVSAVVYSA